MNQLRAKWRNWELMLATNFGSLWPEVTKFGSQNFGYQIWFCTRLHKRCLYSALRVPPLSILYTKIGWVLIITHLLLHIAFSISITKREYHADPTLNSQKHLQCTRIVHLYIFRRKLIMGLHCIKDKLYWNECMCKFILVCNYMEPILLTWKNFNHIMDK